MRGLRVRTATLTTGVHSTLFSRSKIGAGGQGLHLDWPGFVHALIIEHHEGDDDKKQNTDRCESITVRFVNLNIIIGIHFFKVR